MTVRLSCWMFQALQFLVLTMAGWLNRQEEDLIDDLCEENRVLREQLASRPLRLTDAQGRRLAVRGKKLGRQSLSDPERLARFEREGDTGFLVMELVEGETLAGLALAAFHPLCAYRGINQMGDEKARS